MLFNEKKAAQTAAFFTFSAGGKINVLKLMKLMYLAEREAFLRYGEPIIGDMMVSMPNGPVLSMSYDCTATGGKDPLGWENWISDRAGYEIGLQKHISDPFLELRELSQADFDVLQSIWNAFGGFTQWQLIEYTHDSCPEWEDPKGSSAGIPIERLLKALGYCPDDRQALESRLEEHEMIGRVLSHAH